MQTPAGPATLRAAASPASTTSSNALAASAGRAGGRRPARGDRARPGALRRRARPLAGQADRARRRARHADRRHATTPTPTRCAPRSTSSPRLPAPRWLVLGDMGEVGDQGPAFHREVGAYAHERGIESLWAAGAESAQHGGAVRRRARLRRRSMRSSPRWAKRRRPHRSSSRARASCGWSGSSPRSPASRRETRMLPSLAKDRERHAA